MDFNMIQRQVIDMSLSAASTAQAISKVAINHIGKAFEWIQTNFPVVMNQASAVAQKVAVTTRPYLISLGTWAIENKAALTNGAIGVVLGVTLASILFAKMKPATA